MMFRLLLLFTSLVVISSASILKRYQIKKLTKDLKELQDQQDEFFIYLEALHVNFTEKFESLQLHQVSLSGSTEDHAGSMTSGSSAANDPNFLERLSDLEGRVEAIKNYLVGEKKGDIVLRKKSEEVIEQMEGKVKETEVVIGALKNDVANSLMDFNGKIVAVNETAHVKVNANGAVLYGGIGASCSTGGGECVTPDSECRGGRCQCAPGLSYHLRDRKCVASCTKYGGTYQSVARRIIRGFNDLTLEKVNLADCTKRCSTEKAFVCRSFDYFERRNMCFLSASVKADAGKDDWEYNYEGYHFQRDCEM